MNLLRAIENLVRRPAGADTANEEQITALKNEIQQLKALQKASDRATGLKAQEKLITEVASPLSQLILQEHLVVTEGGTLTARDVLLNVKGIVRVLQENGMSVIGTPREITVFDLQIHESALQDFAPAQGQEIQIRYSGIAFHETVVRKAAVGPIEAAK